MASCYSEPLLHTYGPKEVAKPRRVAMEVVMRQIGILVVHGIGEQKWFQTLDQITTNFYRALKERYGAGACRQVLDANQASYLGDEVVWREAPVRLQWRGPKDEYEAIFREVYWADLDEPENGFRFLRFVYWGLTVAARRRDKQSTRLHPPGAYGMRPPTDSSLRERISVRLQLLLVSVFFLMLLSTVGIAHWILRRVPQINILGRVLRILYDYLGDVKLYQGENLRWDRIEAAGETSRVVIRRRMVSALLKMALDPAIEEYYIIAHSLGTVVAFNGLMETEVVLANFLTQDLWSQAHTAGLVKTLPHPDPLPRIPERPLWLGPTDAIDRTRFFARLRGLLTLGSPLDKFAAIWPHIVPVNCQPLPNNVPWHNVADAQDIVGAGLDLFGDDHRDCPTGNAAFSPSSPFMVGGLALENHTWADQCLFFLAHTSYWLTKPGKDRLINRFIDWLEQGNFAPPPNSLPPFIATLLFIVQLIGVFVMLVFVIAGIVVAVSLGAMTLLQAMIVVCIGAFTVVGLVTFIHSVMD